MKNIKKIKTEIRDTSQFKSIVEVYEEISAMKMRNIREGIVDSREFLERLAYLSNEVGSDLASVVGTGGSATVYLSASSGMYGELPEKVFNAFLSHIEKNKTTVFIFGKQVRAYVEKYRPNLKFNYYDLDDRKSIEELLAESLKSLVDFSVITVFYGKFHNLINQDAASVSIMGDFFKEFNTNTDKKDVLERQFKYIYEPSVLEVSNKFATEIKTSVLEGMIKENNLAKTGSRLMHLDQAYENVEKKLALLEIVKNRENKRVEDKKQQERIKRLWL